LSLGVDDHANECVNDEIEPGRRVVGGIVRKKGRRRGLRVGGDEERALIGKIPVRSGARDRRRLGSGFDGGRRAFGHQLASCADERVAGAALLLDAPVELIRD
jgi:hypothetical protein